jgi:hypothetical protein
MSRLGSIWAYVGDDHDVLFRYTPTGEGATGPWTFLAGRTGYVQADAATVFDRLFTGQAAQAVEVGCLSPETPRASIESSTSRMRANWRPTTVPYCDAIGGRRSWRTCIDSVDSRARRNRRAPTSPRRLGISSITGRRPHAVSRGRPPRSR